MRGIASETSTFLAFQQQETSKPGSINFGADIYGSKKKVRLYFFFILFIYFLTPKIFSIGV